jgi:hypothetical protein
MKKRVQYWHGWLAGGFEKARQRLNVQYILGYISGLLGK